MLLCGLFVWAFSAVLCLAAVAGVSLSADQLAYLKDDPKVTHLVSFEIASVDPKNKVEALGTLELALFGEKLPITVANFLEKSYSVSNGYQGSIFHRIVKDFVVQGGNLMRKPDGYSAIDFKVFDDEAFPVKHNKVGRLSMANSGANTNGCQFFITTGKSFPHLDGKHVVFGQMVLGFQTLDVMNFAETLDSRPVNDITISKVTVTKVVSESAAKTKPASGGGSSDGSITPGYKYLMIMCVALAVIYASYRYKGRKTLVDLATFKM